MLKDRFIHEKLGIPIQTLQNWKKSDGYTFLVYQYLIHQDQKPFETKTKSITDLNNYTMMKPVKFASLIKEHWNKFDEFSEYEPFKSIATENDNEDQAILVATHENKPKQTLAIQFVSGFSKRKDLFDIGLKKLNKYFIEVGLELPKIIYVANSATQPKYFSEYTQDLSLMSYAELFEKISDKKILIV